MGRVELAKSRSARDIAPIPGIASGQRKLKCARSLEGFDRTYFPEKFDLAWSLDHREAIATIEQAVWTGGNFCWAMMRGGGKSAHCCTGAMWAIFYGYVKFLALIGATDPKSTELLDDIKSPLESNELLLKDFPEIVYPIRCMEGIAQRAHGQLLDGKRTRIRWSDSQIVFPKVPSSIASESLIRVSGMTGSEIRGMKYVRSDGFTIRPDLVIVDDPQTRESARSPAQVQERESIVNGTIMGVAGPGKKISVLMPCTVIECDDLADRFLNHERYPSWHGKRQKMLYGWPLREQLWEQYKKLSDDDMRAGRGIEGRNAFYLANREAMDEGVRAGWESRKLPDDLSAIQHAMNLYFERGKRAFFAEFQNEPIKPEADGERALTAEEIRAKAIGLPRGIVPLESTKLVSFIDVQKEILVWGVIAVQDDFTGHLVDWGCYPDQKRDYWTKADVKKTLLMVSGATSVEEAIRSGLDSVASLILARDWQREDGGIQRIGRCLVDAHWGEMTDVVKTFCRQSGFASVLTPSFGIGVTASSIPLNDKAKKKGTRSGMNWNQPPPLPGHVRHVAFDANFFKTFSMARLATARGGSGCFTLFGAPEDHMLTSDQLVAEYPVMTTGRGRVVTEWKVKPHRPDNEMTDILAGCCVAASMEGAALQQMKVAEKKERRFVSVAELKAKAKHHGRSSSTN